MRTEAILSNEHLQAIGLVTSEWAELEFYLHATIWALADLEDQFRGNAITDHLRAQQLSDALDSVAYHRLGDSHEYENIKTICKDIRTLYDKRNRFAHAKWQLDKTDNQVYRLNRRSKKRLAAGWDPVDSKEILAVAQEISDLIDRIDPIFHQYKPASWPNEPRRPSSQ